MLEHTASDRSVAEVMQLLLDNMTAQLASSVAFRPGAVDLLQQLDASGIPVALVTSSVRVHVEVVLAQLPVDVFEHHVTADDVTELKPHPMPYQTALGLLDATAARTVVLEDSPAGVAAAEAAGCHVVAVPSVVPIEMTPRRTVVESLVEVDVELLRALVTRS
jgi:HAD superfamily hydrolase (TIGR01509 family)